MTVFKIHDTWIITKTFKKWFGNRCLRRLSWEFSFILFEMYFKDFSGTKSLRFSSKYFSGPEVVLSKTTVEQSILA